MFTIFIAPFFLYLLFSFKTIFLVPENHPKYNLLT